MLKGIDHIAIAVPVLDEAVPLWRDRFGFDLDGYETVESQKVRVAILSKGPHRIELMEPTEPDSPIGRFLEKRGPGIHHICFRSDNLDEDIVRLKEKGYQFLSEEPSLGAHNTRVIFIHPKSCDGVLIEINEYPEGHH